MSTADLEALAPAVPATAAGLTPEWLTQALAAGGRGGARVVAVASERIGEGIGVLAELYRLRPTYAPGAAAGPPSLIAKLHASNPDVRELCAVYGFYERETRFYREVASTIELRTPEHYFSAFDGASGDCVILMEDLAPARSPDQVAGLTLAELSAAVDGIATLHGRWWGDPRLQALRAIMPSVADLPYANSIENYRDALPLALEGLRSLGHADLARVAEKLARSADGLLVAMTTEPLTLNHGDFRTDNLMFREGAAGPQLTVVDWQIVMQVRGPFDVGYLMGGAVPTELRRAEEASLLRRYHDRLIDLGVTGYSFEDCRLDYRRAVLLGLVYWAEGYPVADKSNPRIVALYASWAARLAAAVQDLDLESLLDA